MKSISGMWKDTRHHIAKEKGQKWQENWFCSHNLRKRSGVVMSNAKMDKKLGCKIKMLVNAKKDDSRIPDAYKRNEFLSRTGGSWQKKTPKAEGVDFGKKLIEFTEMEVDEDVEKALNKCKIGFTWFVENAENLQYKLRDIGLVKYKVTSLSDRKFLIRKDKADSWDDLKNTDLSV